MRKLFFLFLFLVASVTISAQSANDVKPGDIYKTVHPYDVSAALDKCVRVNRTHPNPNDESPSAIYISADGRVLFHVYSNEKTGMFDFVVLQTKKSDGTTQF